MDEQRVAEPEARKELQTVVFRLGTEFYGIDIFRVNEIIRMRDITPVPRTEPHIRGLVNLRGKTIPVVDIRMRMNLPESEDAESTRIIVVDTAHGNVGIVVDAVTEVVSLDRDTIATLRIIRHLQSTLPWEGTPSATSTLRTSALAST